MTNFDYTICKYATIVDKLFPYKYLNVAVIVCTVLVFIGVILEVVSMNPLIPCIPIMLFIVIVLVKLSANRIEYFRAKRYCKKNNISMDEFNVLILQKYPKINQ